MSQITLQANHCWIDAFDFDPKVDYGSFGLYILGIRSNHENGRILPYYVGITEGSISSRVSKHVYDSLKPKTTYTIFSENFLRNQRGTSSDFIKRHWLPSDLYPDTTFGNEILYLNKDEFFSKAVGSQFIPFVKRIRPLDLLGKYSSSVPLHQAATLAKNSIFAPESLFFTPITVFNIRDSHFGGNGETFLTRLETYIKFSLKINVISRSNTFKTLTDFLRGHHITLNIKCPEIDQEFHPEGPRPTNQSTILFP